MKLRPMRSNPGVDPDLPAITDRFGDAYFSCGNLVECRGRNMCHWSASASAVLITVQYSL